jgi:Uma2 family endonuclease
LDDALVRVTPHLVIEVASPRPRDARRDRVDKLRDYARAGIRYYWILDPRLRSLEIFELTERGRYALAVTASDGRNRVPGCAGLVVDLDELWKEVDEAARPAVRSSRKKR